MDTAPGPNQLRLSGPLRTLPLSVLRGLCRLLFRVDYSAPSQAFAAPRLLIIANHESLLDGLLLVLFLPVDPVFLIHSHWVAKPWMRPLLRFVDYLAVDPANPLAMKQVVQLLERGRPVVIFPEGRITRTGGLMKVYEGPAFLAAKTGACLLPVHLEGTLYSILSRKGCGWRRQLLPKIRITVQSPIAMPSSEGHSFRQQRARAAQTLLDGMQNMLAVVRPGIGLFAAAREAARLHGWRRACLEDAFQGRITVRALFAAALLWGQNLETITGPGERVGLLLPDTLFAAALVLGLSRYGRVPVLINSTTHADNLRAVCIAAGLRRIICPGSVREQCGLNSASLPGVELLDPDRIRDSLTSRFRLGPPPSELSELVLFPEPQNPCGIALSHEALLTTIARIRAVLPITAKESLFNALPLCTPMGLVGTLLALLTGAGLVLPPHAPSTARNRTIPELVYDRDCTILLADPDQLADSAACAHPYDFHGLHHVLAIGAAPETALQHQWCEQFGLRLLHGYSCTTAAPLVALNTPIQYRAGTVGRLLPGLSARIVPTPGAPLGGGRLQIRGPGLISGLLSPEAPGIVQPPPSESGWRDTGTLAHLDADGFITLSGHPSGPPATSPCAEATILRHAPDQLRPDAAPIP
ncbi:MAG: AMP-binding protein [Desulfobulbus sp.]|jgi:acyl-[acyl-carrier-protein]-phospholipid O-acyltransferase/long-chain-fatty-acid--[acyl-carrier-protein] ligase